MEKFMKNETSIMDRFSEEVEYKINMNGFYQDEIDKYYYNIIDSAVNGAYTSDTCIRFIEHDTRSLNKFLEANESHWRVASYAKDAKENSISFLKCLTHIERKDLKEGFSCGRFLDLTNYVFKRLSLEEVMPQAKKLGVFVHQRALYKGLFYLVEYHMPYQENGPTVGLIRVDFDKRITVDNRTICRFSMGNPAEISFEDLESIFESLFDGSLQSK